MRQPPNPYVDPPRDLTDAALLLPYPQNRDTLFGLYEAANYPDGPYGYLLMTRATFKATKQIDLVDGSGNPKGTRVFLGGNGAPVTTVTTATYETDAAAYVSAAATYVTDTAVATSTLATLVADGATPTQAHVTAHNNAVTQQVTDYTALAAAYTALAADYTAMKTQITALSPETGDVYASFDTSKITTRTQLKAALDKVLIEAVSSGRVTP